MLVHITMPPRQCSICQQARAALKRPKTGQALCRECFYRAFEDEIHHTIVDNSLFERGDTVAIGASGGKGQPQAPLSCRPARRLAAFGDERN